MQGVRDGGFSIGWGARHRDETYCSDFQSYYCPDYMEMHAFLRAYCGARPGCLRRLHCDITKNESEQASLLAVEGMGEQRESLQGPRESLDLPGSHQAPWMVVTPKECEVKDVNKAVGSTNTLGTSRVFGIANSRDLRTPKDILPSKFG